MNTRFLVIREMMNQKLTTVVGLAAVMVAAGVFVSQITLLDAHDMRTAAILAEKEEALDRDMKVMEDDYRKIMKELGFNLLILPAGQRLDDFHADGFSSKFMPEDYVTRLAKSDIVTIRHLLPSIEQKISWPERSGRAIILMGTRGEVPFLQRNEKEPILTAVAPGNIVLGYELWHGFGLGVGDSLRLRGRTFTVSECYSQRGTKDDVTAWIDLAAAQKMLGREGLINCILALKCICANNDIESVRAQVAAIVPDVRVIEVENKVVTRALARERAAAVADSTLRAEKKYRAVLRDEQEKTASWLIPLVTLGSAMLVGVLAFLNVRERRSEIAVLRAIGFRSKQILSVFLAKALIVGFLGAVAGSVAGFFAGVATSGLPSCMSAAKMLFSPALFILTLVTSPLVAATACWVPALIAAGQDPADILRRE